MGKNNFLAVQQRALKVRDLYASSASKYYNFLVYGDYGTGKTSIATTCPTPVFIDSFDPGGTKTLALQPLIESGDIRVENRWEADSWKEPWAFRAWEKEMFARRGEGFFDHIGTYMLDSVTKFAMSMMYEILKLGDPKGSSRVGETPQIQDYLNQQLTTVDWFGILMSLPCHIIVTGHIGLDKDEVTGKMETGLLLWGKLANQVPLCFDEKYVTRTVKTSDGVKHEMLTKNDGYYKAESRMGGSRFQMVEPPDIRALIRKAGKECQDKPSLFADAPDLESAETSV